ncbi:MAG: nitronate monooxygenase [Clostridiales bacterium]|nr:nitronate monooxygenase [Clostridiales bacterium]MDY4061096.1 nitronate monooxygenase [Anaerovoracaceae bacterium]
MKKFREVNENMGSLGKKIIEKLSAGNPKWSRLDYPIIQGGMGVGISMGNLAGAVAAEGGMGVISTALIGFREKNFKEDHIKADENALRKEIRLAKQIAGGHGMIGINAMTVTKDFKQCVQVAVEEGVDCIISGAGLPLSLPEYAGKDTSVLLAPIVSGAKAARLMMRSWERNHKRLPDFFVVEGRDAGGHLGFKPEEFSDNNYYSLEAIVRDVVDVAGDIPVFAAGSIFDTDDIKRAISWGAMGVQIGTRFIATHECDGRDGFKNVLLRAKAEDLRIIRSPVGLPGRAIFSKLLQDVKEECRKPPKECINCITTCNPQTTPYCISEALIAAFYGDEENGLFFSGVNAGKIHKIVSVKELMTELKAAFE